MHAVTYHLSLMSTAAADNRVAMSHIAHFTSMCSVRHVPMSFLIHSHMNRLCMINFHMVHCHFLMRMCRTCAHVPMVTCHLFACATCQPCASHNGLGAQPFLFASLASMCNDTLSVVCCTARTSHVMHERSILQAGQQTRLITCANHGNYGICA